MTEDVLSNKLEKFYFNLHIFDDDHVEDVIEEEPPPPIFSEEQLEAAKKEAFERGKQEGVDETKKSRSELISKALEKISQDSSTLFQAETQREKVYEQEAVALSLVLFKTLFPVYQKRFGFEELKETMTSVLKKQQGQKAITIHVEPDALEGTDKLLTELSSRGTNIQFQVLADEALGNGACRMSWKDGGAVTNPKNIADEICATIQQVLAASGAKGHDEDVQVQDTEEPIKTDDQTIETTSDSAQETPISSDAEHVKTEVTPEEDTTAATQSAEITEKPDE